MLTNQFMQFLAGCSIFQQRKLYHFHVTEVIEVTVFIPYVSNSPTHTCSKVTSGLTQYDYSSASHILTAMVAYSFYYRNGSRVTYGKTFTYATIDIHLSTCGTIQQGITSDYVVFGQEITSYRRLYRNMSSAQALAQVIIRFTFQLEADPMWKESTETLSG